MCYNDVKKMREGGKKMVTLVDCIIGILLTVLVLGLYAWALFKEPK